MTLDADAVTLILPAILAAIIVGIVVYGMLQRRRAARRTRRMAAVRAIIVDYFRRSGVAVSVECVLTGSGGYAVLVESEPMKRFRLSHIIEMTLRDYVRKAIKVELEKIYWRFPVKEVVQAAAVPPEGAPTEGATAAQDKEAAADELSDDYINEGLEHYRHIPKPEVDELPWEAFEEVTTTLRKPPEES